MGTIKYGISVAIVLFAFIALELFGLFPLVDNFGMAAKYAIWMLGIVLFGFVLFFARRQDLK